jgi:hypothetical protein
MNINRLTLLLLLLLIPGSNSLAQQLSPDELTEILGIKSWRVPMPKDSYNLQWHDVPKPFDEGTKFVIADISHMLVKQSDILTRAK